MEFQTDSFEDVHLHASSVRLWNQTYSQLSPGALNSSLSQLVGRRFQLFREKINQRVVQHGVSPRSRVCFAVPLAAPGAMRMQGREADDRSVFVLKGGEEFMFHMPMGMDMLAITFDAEAFEQVVVESPWAGELKTLLKQPVVKVSEQRLAESRARLINLFDRAVLPDGSGPSGAAAEQELEQDLVEEMLCLLTDPQCDKAQRHLSSSGSFIVDRCHQMTVADISNPPSVLDLCNRLRVSRRTVQNSFRSITQTTPVNYIRCIRLNGVRRALTDTCTGELTIGDAAARWGFFHLSHFAADYQALFGELPSQTRRAKRPVRRAEAPMAVAA